jgi:putative effector of murein hydrolase LrgA (UPF0299 family)
VKASAATLPGTPLGARQRWLVAGKLALVLVGLGLLLRWALTGLAPADGSGALHLAPEGLIGAVVLNQAALFAAALRLRATLAAFGVRLSAAQAMAIHLRSLFYFFFVPLSVGLEVSRYLDIRRIDADVPTKKLVLVLLLDRVLGLVAAVAALAAFAYLVLPASVWARVDAAWLALGAAAVLAGAGLVLLRRPWRERAADLLRVLKAGSVRLLLPVLLSLLALALVCASVYVVAAASGWAAGFAEIAFALSASLLGMALPLSLLGVTVGEATGVGVTALLGLAPALAVMLVSLAYVGRLLGAVQGAALELHGGVRVLRRQAAPDSGETL